MCLHVRQSYRKNTRLVIEEMLPGATIRVWSIEDDAEIGDGAGHLIKLSRELVSGEEIIVMQQVDDECVDPVGYIYTVL